MLSKNFMDRTEKRQIIKEENCNIGFYQNENNSASKDTSKNMNSMGN